MGFYTFEAGRKGKKGGKSKVCCNEADERGTIMPHVAYPRS